MKFQLVSDIHHFSTKDVFDGYKLGLQQAGVDFIHCDLTEILKYHSFEHTLGLLLSQSLIKNNEITHILYVSGLSIPRWVYESKYDKKVCILSLDDPHCSMPLLRNKDCFDYYFTNEKTIEYKNAGIHYLPTATSASIPKEIGEHHKSDIVFVGTMYPSRVKMLEKVALWCQNNNKVFKIITPSPVKSTVLKKHIVINSIIDNNETKRYYTGAEVVINVDRDINWSPQYGDNNPNLLDVGKEPESTNPRFYEIALCKSLQFYIDPRKEAIDLLGDNIITSTKENVDEKLKEAFNLSEDKKNEMVENSYNEVIKNHTYYSRVKTLINILNEEV